MEKKPSKVYERVYIHAAKVQSTEGWALVIHSMDAFSEFAFKAAFNSTPHVTIEVLNQLFENILKDYNPTFHPKQIVFVTNLSEEYEQLIQQTKAINHRVIFNKEVTIKAMKGLISSMRFEVVAL